MEPIAPTRRISDEQPRLQLHAREARARSPPVAATQRRRAPAEIDTGKPPVTSGATAPPTRPKARTNRLTPSVSTPSGRDVDHRQHEADAARRGRIAPAAQQGGQGGAGPRHHRAAEPDGAEAQAPAPGRRRWPPSQRKIDRQRRPGEQPVKTSAQRRRPAPAHAKDQRPRIIEADRRRTCTCQRGGDAATHSAIGHVHHQRDERNDQRDAWPAHRSRPAPRTTLPTRRRGPAPPMTAVVGQGELTMQAPPDGRM